jgi:hypothetical protein
LTLSARSSILFILSVVLAFACYGQTTVASNGTVIIDGKRYVLIPEKTFEKVEKMVDEIPVLRSQAEAYKRQHEIDDAVIQKQATLIELQTATIATQDKAIAAQTAEADARKREAEANAKALNVATGRITELEQKVKRSNRRTVFAAIGAAIISIIALR